jgi:hypothetical protein
MARLASRRVKAAAAARREERDQLLMEQGFDFGDDWRNGLFDFLGSGDEEPAGVDQSQQQGEDAARAAADGEQQQGENAAPAAHDGEQQREVYESVLQLMHRGVRQPDRRQDRYRPY